MKKKILSLALVLVLAVTLCSIPALATETPSTPASVLNSDSAVPASAFGSAGLSKILHVADEVDISGVNSYSFSFTAQELAGGENPASISNQSVTTSLRSGDAAVGSVTFAAIFGDDPATKGFTHAGEYVYLVQEVAPTAPTSTATVTKTLTADTQGYMLHVFVGNGTNGLEYTAITVYNGVKSGTTWTDGDTKLDPTIDKWEVPYADETMNSSKDFRFTNTYTEVIEDDDGVLTVTKTITGTYADLTKEFPVTVDIHIPSTATSNDVAVNVNGTSVDPTAGTTSQDYSVSADLTNNGTIEFTKLPAGTTFTVSETQSTSPVYTSKITGDVATPDTAYVSGDRTDVEGVTVLAAGKEVEIENNREDIVPTGIIIDNLPYILLAAVAIVGIIFLALKKKSQEED